MSFNLDNMVPKLIIPKKSRLIKPSSGIIDEPMDDVDNYIVSLRQDFVVAAEELLKPNPSRSLTLWWGQQLLIQAMSTARFIMCVAGRGLGKSVSKYSYIQTEDGLIRLNELYGEDGFDGLVEKEERVDFNKKVNLWSGFESRNTKNVIYEKKIDTIKIGTSRGYNVEVGYDRHKILVWNKETCTIDWVLARDLFNSKYRIIIQKHGRFGGRSRVLSDAAYFAGLLVGDGSYQCGQNVSFTSEDQELLDFVSCFINSDPSFEINVKKVKDERTSKTYNYYFSKDIHRLLKSLELEKYQFGEEKEVPLLIRQSDKDIIANFLRGYFDTDGCVEQQGALVTCSSKSFILIEQVHLLLLMFGIISKRFTKEINGIDYYIIQISDRYVDIFNKEIGFRLTRKQKILNKRNHKFNNTNIDVIPGLNILVREEAQLLNKSKYAKIRYSSFSKERGEELKRIWQKIRTYAKLAYDVPVYNLPLIIEYFSSFEETRDSYLVRICKEIIEGSFFFDSVISIEKSQEDCYDHTVEGDSCFWCNGSVNHNTYIMAAYAILKAMLFPRHKVGIVSASFRQAKFLFAEIQKLYEYSPAFRQACIKPPVMGADNCYIHFKNGASITALPLGDGEKIRGARFHTLLLDEAVKVPQEILELSIMPMMNVPKDPMMEVEREESKTMAREKGLDLKDDFSDLGRNQIIMMTTAWFQFSYLYKLFKEWTQKQAESEQLQIKFDKEWEASNRKTDRKVIRFDYHVFSFPYTAAPKGFLDMAYVQMCRKTMSPVRFAMENLAFWPPDTDGFYPAHLLEAARGNFPPILKAEKGKQYVMSVDPARESDNFIIGVAELGAPNRLVYMKSMSKTTFKTTNGFEEMHQEIRKTLRLFPNMVRIGLDQGGGGLTIRDSLSVENLWQDSVGGIHRDPPIYQIKGQNDIHDKQQVEGARRIIDFIAFSTEWINPAAWKLRDMLEQGDLQFPTPPHIPEAGNQVKDSKFGGILVDARDIVCEEFDEAIYECTNIEHKELPSKKGFFRFDVISKTLKKDRWAVLTMLARVIYDIQQEGLINTELDTSGKTISDNPHIYMTQYAAQQGPINQSGNITVGIGDGTQLRENLRINASAAALSR